MRPGNLCIICKGSRALCGLKRCPLLARIDITTKINIDTEFFGPSTSVFVGRIGYPNVFIGPVVPVLLKNLYEIDNPNLWFGMEYSDIISFRSSMLRSKSKQNIFSNEKIVDNIQQIALSIKPIDVEMSFDKKPTYKVMFSDVVQPMGPSVSIKKLNLAENPKIPQKIEKIVSDDLKAKESSFLLYKTGLDVYKISTIFSTGALGLQKNKKLVPTRYSITAIDDIICKNLLNYVRNYPSINEFRVYSSQYLDNHFEILLIPGNWEYENFEAWSPGSFWASYIKNAEIVEEYEPFQGRTSYAEKEGGGYYAARIGVVEALYKMKRQARVIVFREIYEGYMIPLGVWVVRETVRNAFKNPCKIFSTLDEALNHINTKLRLPIEYYKKISIILRQKRLDDFKFDSSTSMTSNKTKAEINKLKTDKFSI
ncbi:MAG: Nre family DNA repair protein [Candidatus Aenigmatarchaeota archaeon]